MTTSWQARLFLAMLTFLAGGMLPAAAQVVYVCDAGDGSQPASGKANEAFPAIGAAIAALSPADGDDTIVVFAPVDSDAYRENIVLLPGLTLISAREFFHTDTARIPVIAGQAGAIITGADSAVLCGFQVNGPGLDKGNWGVSLPGVSHMSISRVTARNCEYGFHLNSAWDNRLADNSAESNVCGFVVTSSLTNRLDRNRSADNAWYGYVLAMSNGNILAENSSERNGQQGYWLAMAARNQLLGNRSTANTGDGYYLHGARDNTVTGNTAEANAGFGFYLTGASQGGSFTGNAIVPGDSNAVMGIFSDAANAFAFTDCYWSTTDAAAIAAMLQGPNAAAITWQPFRPTR